MKFGAVTVANGDSFDINGTRRGIKIYRPNLFCVLPTWKKKDDIRPLETFVAQGINY